MEEARRNLAGALEDMAETNLLRGEPLPLPDSSRSAPDADVPEPIYVVLRAGQQLSVSVASPAP